MKVQTTTKKNNPFDSVCIDKANYLCIFEIQVGQATCYHCKSRFPIYRNHVQYFEKSKIFCSYNCRSKFRKEREKQVMELKHNSFREFLRSERKRFGLTRKELAKELEMTMGLIAAYERGEIRVGRIAIQRISKFTGVPIETIEKLALLD